MTLSSLGAPNRGVLGVLSGGQAQQGAATASPTASSSGGVCNHGCESDATYLNCMREAQAGGMAATYRAAARFTQCVLEKCASTLTPAEQAEMQRLINQNLQNAARLGSP